MESSDSSFGLFLNPVPAPTDAAFAASLVLSSFSFLRLALLLIMSLTPPERLASFVSLSSTGKAEQHPPHWCSSSAYLNPP